MGETCINLTNSGIETSIFSIFNINTDISINLTNSGIETTKGLETRLDRVEY